MVFSENLDRPFSTGDDDLLWGVGAIAACANLPARSVYYLLEKNVIDAWKVRRRWVSTRRRILASLSRAHEVEVSEPLSP
jgi:hypothetical protein